MTEMSPAEAVFFAAAARPTEERAAYLARACAGHDDLIQRVEQMLAARPLVGDFLEPAWAQASRLRLGEPGADGGLRRSDRLRRLGHCRVQQGERRERQYADQQCGPDDRRLPSVRNARKEHRQYGPAADRHQGESPIERGQHGKTGQDSHSEDVHDPVPGVDPARQGPLPEPDAVAVARSTSASHGTSAMARCACNR